MVYTRVRNQSSQLGVFEIGEGLQQCGTMGQGESKTVIGLGKGDGDDDAVCLFGVFGVFDCKVMRAGKKPGWQ